MSAETEGEEEDDEEEEEEEEEEEQADGSSLSLLNTVSKAADGHVTPGMRVWCVCVCVCVCCVCLRVGVQGRMHMRVYAWMCAHSAQMSSVSCHPHSTSLSLSHTLLARPPHLHPPRSTAHHDTAHLQGGS